MTTAMNTFYYDQQPMINILDDGDLQPVAGPSIAKQESSSRLARTFKRIRKVLTPVAKKTLDKSELKTRDERRAAEVVLETEERKGKSIKRKLLEGCSPLARLKRRRHENAMDTSSDAPFSPFQRVHEDEPEDATMICDIALPAPDVEMVLEDPVSALVSLMGGLSLSDTDTPMDTSLDTDADLGLTVDLHLDTDIDMHSELDTGADSSAARSAGVTSISWTAVSGNDNYTPYKQTGRFKPRGTQLLTLADCWRLMDEQDAKTAMDVDQRPLRRTARLPASLARLDKPELGMTCFDPNASTDTLVDGSFYQHDSSSDATLVESEHDSASGCLLKALRSLSLGKMTASGGKTSMSSRTRRHA